MKKTGLFNYSKYLLAILLSASVVFFTSCGDDDEESTPPPAPVTDNAYEVLSSKDELSELKGFIDQFDLDVVLSDSTSKTFFAPNNDAFTKLRTTLGTDDLSTIDPNIIEEVLKFHVVNGQSLTIDQLVDASSVVTVQGESIVMNADGTVATGGSDDEVVVLEADIAATNGTVHVVETILIPPTIFAAIGQNLGQLSQAVFLGADFTTLAAAIAKADTFAAGASQTTITSVLTGSDLYTVFAPVNTVFETANITLDTYSGQEWYGIITNHVVAGVTVADSISAGATYTTLAGGTITVLTTSAPTDEPNGILTGIALDSNGDTDAEAQVAVGDAFEANNGVLHALAGVLVP